VLGMADSPVESSFVLKVADSPVAVQWSPFCAESG
jgi:hypothetical protein